MRRGGFRRPGLQFKIVAGLLVIAAVPLLVSALLIGEIGVIAQNFASNEAARLRPHLEKAQEAYRELVAAKKATYHEAARRIAQGMAASPVWRAETIDQADLERLVGRVLGEEEDLQQVQVASERGVAAMAISAALPGDGTGRWRDLSVTESLPRGYRVELTFVTRVDFLEELRALGPALSHADTAAAFRASLPRSYRDAFLVVVGCIVVVTTTAGIVLARRMTRRLENMADATQLVAAGDLSARVDVPGRDEIGALSDAFNLMVEQLERDQQQIAYLQKMSAWQDVARRLAHEIKNPLTPIQLAVQQCVSSYRGDDERYRKTLADAEEIVEEEIAGLRRLVDAFRSLGRLPRAKPEPLDIATVVGDLQRDPELADNLIAQPPPTPLTVSGDRLLLRRLLANLVENGMHAGREADRPGMVVVAWRAHDGRARIEIDDQGHGVPAERRDAIFDPYVTTKEHGTGLGLAIAKKIALEHHGDLELAAEPAPSGGARFVLRLPIADAVEPARSS